MAMICKVRWMLHRQKKSAREISRITSLSRNTIRKWLGTPLEGEPKCRAGSGSCSQAENGGAKVCHGSGGIIPPEKVVNAPGFIGAIRFYRVNPDYSGSDRSPFEFRHKISRYGGLADRHRLHSTTAASRDIQAAEKVEMDQLKKEIEALPHMGAYGPKAVKKILKGEWRGDDSWVALSGYAGFHESYFRNIYGYLCSYSHASHASAQQVGQAQSLDDQRSLASMCIGIGLVLMAQFTQAYIELFDDAKLILDDDPEAKALVDRWNFSAVDWEKVIGRQPTPQRSSGNGRRNGLYGR